MQKICVVVVLLYALKIECKIIEGHLWTGENWQFLSRFCFLSLHGKFEYEIKYDLSYTVQNIDLYYDSESQWRRVYGDKKDLFSCEEKESVLQNGDNQYINLTTTVIVSGCKISTFNDTKTSHMYCKGSRNFKTARERWWFIAISNCKSKKGLRMRYKFLMTNGHSGDLLHYHFSADEFYILPILIAAFCQSVIIIFFSFWSIKILKARQLLHTTFKIFFLSIWCHISGLLLLLLHYLTFGFNGMGLPKTKIFGRILEATAETMFLILLILLSKGYTVTRARLRKVSSFKIAGFGVMYSIMYLTLFLIEIYHNDPGQVLYIYESYAGYGIVILRTIGWIMFIYSIFFTLKHYPEKGSFYYPFFCFYSLWFLSGPLVIIVSNHIISNWVREKVVISIEHFIAMIGQIFFLYITRPSIQNINFPYHVRTSQIGVMEAISRNTLLGENTLDNFSHEENYRVLAQRVEIFTISSVCCNDEVVKKRHRHSDQQQLGDERDNALSSYLSDKANSDPLATSMPTNPDSRQLPLKNIVFNPNDEQESFL